MKHLLPLLCVSLAVGSSFVPLSEYQRLVASHDSRHIAKQLQFSEKMFFSEATNVVGTLHLPKQHQFQRQPYVANGYFGARVPSLGQGFAYDQLTSSGSDEDLRNGWPQFNRRFAGAFAAGFYNLQATTKGTNFPWLEQYGMDSTIAAIPQWTSLTVAWDAHVLGPMLAPEAWGNISDYSQTLSLEDGVVSTLFTWKHTLQMRFNVTANKKHRSVGSVTLEVHNPSKEQVDLTVTDRLDFDTSHGCRLHSIGKMRDGIFVMFAPNNVRGVFGAITSRLVSAANHSADTESNLSSSRIDNKMQLEIAPGASAVVHKIVGIATTDLDPERYVLSSDVLDAATLACFAADETTLAADNRGAWKKALRNSLDVIFPDNALLTLAARASLYHLHANTRGDARGLTAALGVSGLSSDSYAGQVFWDTDLWMLMGILPFSADISRSLLHYRQHTHQQAVKNVRSPSNPFLDSQGAVYPWTSGRYGNCTASGPCFDYEYHINSAVAYSAFNMYLSGAGENFLREDAFPIIDAAARFYASYLHFNETMGKYTTHNLTDPDEYANQIDNGAYTNAAILSTLQCAAAVRDHLEKPVPDAYRHIAANMHIPTSADDSRVVLEYTDMPFSAGIKQADVVMMMYPLGYQFSSPLHAQANIDFYALKQVDTGPAMTYPIYSIVAAATLDSGCSAESYLMKSVQPYLRGPFAQFLEQSNDNFDINGGINPAFPFLTAHGGFLQAILHGLLGLRFSYEVFDGRMQRFMEIKAYRLSMLPNGVFFPEIQYMNQSLSLNLSSTSVTIVNNGPVTGHTGTVSGVNLRILHKTGRTSSMLLKPSKSVFFSVSARKKVQEKSLTECGRAWFLNINRAWAGDVTLLMHDGSNSTRWKAHRNSTSKVLIDLKETKPVTRGRINWGALPPKKLVVHTERVGIAKHYPEIQLALDILDKVSFGPAEGSITQAKLFRRAYEAAVDITRPFDMAEYVKIAPVSRHNITSFEFSTEVITRFIVVEIEGVHDENCNGGAEIHSIDFF